MNKAISSLQKDINRLRKVCDKFNKSNTLRKYQTTQFNLLIKKLLKEGRISKDEVREFIKSKDEVIQILSLEKKS